MINPDPVIAIIKAVQSKLGVDADGQPGPMTWSAICRALRLPVYMGLVDKIKATQRLLGIAVDGIDGPATWASISRAVEAGSTPEQLQAADKRASVIGSFAYWQSLITAHAPQHAATPVKHVAVRGYLEGTSKEDRTDIYDDAIVVLADNGFTIFRAAVDPSTYLIRHPINADGAAQLTTGLWLFRRGLHHDNPLLPCFIQAEDFIVDRLHLDGSVSHQDKGDFGIHIHSGGSEDTTDHFSAGCQIVHNPDGYRGDNGGWGEFWYQKFYYPQVKIMQERDQTILPYLLINAEELPAI